MMTRLEDILDRINKLNESLEIRYDCSEFHELCGIKKAVAALDDIDISLRDFHVFKEIKKALGMQGGT